jgi:NADH-quinone oxidoreductase subunit M
MMAAFAGCGLPGFANFVGEVTVFFGAWSRPGFWIVTVLACWGALVIGAIYLLRAVRNILQADLPDKWRNVADAVNPWTKLPFVLLLVALLVFGFFPRLLSDKISPAVAKVVEMSNPALPLTAAQTVAERK